MSQVIDAAKINQLLEAEVAFVAKRSRNFRQICRFKLVRQFTTSRTCDAQRMTKADRDTFRQCLVAFVHRAIVLVRRIFSCNCIIPYINASAVGGQPGT